MQLDLSHNQLCGLYALGRGRACINGTYTTEGITAIVNSLRVNRSLTHLSLGDNHLGDDGVEALSVGIEQSKSLRMLDLSNKDYRSVKFGLKGVTALAKALAVNGSLTECDLQGNNGLGKKGTTMLRNAVQGKAGFQLHL